MKVLFQRSVFLVMCGVPLLVTGCTNSKTRGRGGEESVSSTSSTSAPTQAPSADASGPAPSCGHEVRTLDRGYDEAARTCLWEAYLAGRSAGLKLTRYTIEGDPISITIRVASSSAIDVVEDNRDRFGPRGVRSSTCTKLERGPSTDGRSGFVVRGCRSGVETIEVP